MLGIRNPCMRRTVAIPCLLAALGAGLAAQEDPVPEPTPAQDIEPTRELFAQGQWRKQAAVQGEIKATLWMVYRGVRDLRFVEQRAHLQELQQRYADRGVRIVVVLPTDAGKELAAANPAFGVVEIGERLELEDPELLDLGEGPFGYLPLDVMEDLFLGLGDVARLVDLAEEMQSLLAIVGDGGDLADGVATVAKHLPHSGRAQALRVLHAWWCKGDLTQARAAFDEGLAALADRSHALVEFADLVLRGDRSDPAYAKALVSHVAPIAAAAPEAALAQLVLLRALLRSGQDKLAGRMLTRTAKVVAESGIYQLWFAETLMEAAAPAPYRDLAERAIQAAQVLGADPRLCYAARHKLLIRTGAPLAEAEALMTDARKVLGEDAVLSLNNDAWYLMTRIDTMGRFDTYALAQCEEMQRQEGENLSYGNKDTCSLALFLNGQIARAIELETEALAASRKDPEYAARLARYRAVLAASKAK